MLQAFSTVAAFEPAYFMATGRQQLFSEQQLIDCGWEVSSTTNGVAGCFPSKNKVAALV